MFVATMGFHARISDPVMGGTYMTLLNTVSNLGSKWPGTLVLWLVDIVSLKDCEGVTDVSLDCDTLQEVQVSLIPVVYSLYVCFYRLAMLLEATVSLTLMVIMLKHWFVSLLDCCGLSGKVDVSRSCRN